MATDEEKKRSEQWLWMMDWCKKCRLSPADETNWKAAYVAYVNEHQTTADDVNELGN